MKKDINSVGQTFLFVRRWSDENARLPFENVLWQAGLTDRGNQ